MRTSIQSRLKQFLTVYFQIRNYQDLITGRTSIQTSEEYRVNFKRIMRMTVQEFKNYVDLNLIQKDIVEGLINEINNRYCRRL